MRSRSIVIFSILFGYILLQFLWWEVLLVRQTATIIGEKQKLAELNISDHITLRKEVEALHVRQRNQTIMIVCEGTVFLLLLLFGVHKVRQAHEREFALGRQQNNFFVSITHELKTPIAATRLQLQTLKRGQVTEPQRLELIESALEENERLNLLIENILMASRFESGSHLIQKEQLDFSSLADATVRRYYRNEIHNGRVKPSIQEGIQLSGDKNALSSIITNLIDNALKYSPSDAEVEVALKGIKDQIILMVSDRGTGIPDSEKKEIFKLFYRSPSGNVPQQKGAGLGLYIVQYLAGQHSGRISVEDRSGGGSIFKVSFNEG